MPLAVGGILLGSRVGFAHPKFHFYKKLRISAWFHAWKGIVLAGRITFSKKCCDLWGDMFFIVLPCFSWQFLAHKLATKGMTKEDPTPNSSSPPTHRSNEEMWSSRCFFRVSGLCNRPEMQHVVFSLYISQSIVNIISCSFFWSQDDMVCLPLYRWLRFKHLPFKMDHRWGSCILVVSCTVVL